MKRTGERFFQGARPFVFEGAAAASKLRRKRERRWLNSSQGASGGATVAKLELRSGIGLLRHVVVVHVAVAAVVVAFLMAFMAFGAGKVAVVLAVRVDVRFVLRHGLLRDFVVPAVAADAGFVLLIVDLELGAAVFNVAGRTWRGGRRGTRLRWPLRCRRRRARRERSSLRGVASSTWGLREWSSLKEKRHRTGLRSVPQRDPRAMFYPRSGDMIKLA